MKKFQILTIGLITTMSLSACHHAEENEAPLVGGDRDEHGCIGSAGYSWNTEKQECTRPWEDEAEETTAEITEPNIPEDCASWFDGCNNCFVENGKIGGCTMMYCEPESMQEAKCTKFKEEE